MVTREGAKRRRIAGLAQKRSDCALHGTRKRTRGCAGAGMRFTFAGIRHIYAGLQYRGAHRMSWFGIVLVVIGLYLALKMAGFVMKLAMWALVLFGLYWFLAPRLGLPWPF
jgi:hypothetical protein